MKRLESQGRIARAGICMISAILIGYVLRQADPVFPEEWKIGILEQLNQQAEEFFLPGLTYTQKEKISLQDWVAKNAMQIMPLNGYVEGKGFYETEVEDEDTYRMILEQQARDENEVDENGNLVHPENAASVEDVPPTAAASLDTSIERLRDYDYLISNFYTVDGTTMTSPEELNVDQLLSKDMKLTSLTDGPKVLIFHTHSQEAFADSVPGDTSTSIVGIGEYLTELLNAKGIPAIHDTGVYDLINGKLDRSSAYEFSEAGVRQILAENPSVEVVIDLHRDGVREETHLVTEINGKQTARIMFFNGLSRTRANGDIAYLPNPYIQDNLAFSLQMQLAGEQMYPGFTRHIYLKSYRYSLHMMPKSLLIEAGAQTNTVEEMRNAMEVLASMLHKVLV